jgi:predicted NBD/HSP70 family sugar kinase
VHGQTYAWESVPLEAYVGAEAILDQYGGPLPGSDQETAFTALIDLAPPRRRGAEILDKTALYLYLGVSIADLINVFNPERTILGGWADLLLGEYMLPAIHAAAHGRSLWHLFAETSIELGRLGPDAVTLGAATLPIEAFLGGERVHYQGSGPVGQLSPLAGRGVAT